MTAAAVLLPGRTSLLADDRLSEFSDMLKDIDAEATAPRNKPSGSGKETEKKVSGNGKGTEKKVSGNGKEKKEREEAHGSASGNRKETDSGDRLSDFASLVRDTEEKAGITDSDPQSDRVIRTGDGGGDPDGRLTAMAREVSRIDKEMEKKYGPVIEDKVISDPKEYNDGDRVVATENTKTESLARLKGIRFDSVANVRKNTKDIFELRGDELKSTLGSFEEKEEQEEEQQISARFEGSGDTDFSLDSLLGKKGESLGIFRLTAYDACIICCGKTDGITATGTKAEVGRTIAVDPNVIPFGSRVMINGHIYTAEDSGSKIKGNRIDVFLSTHEEARRFGVKEAEVFLVE